MVCLIRETKSPVFLCLPMACSIVPFRVQREQWLYEPKNIVRTRKFRSTLFLGTESQWTLCNQLMSKRCMDYRVRLQVVVVGINGSSHFRYPKQRMERILLKSRRICKK